MLLAIGTWMWTGCGPGKATCQAGAARQVTVVVRQRETADLSRSRSDSNALRSGGVVAALRAKAAAAQAPLRALLAARAHDGQVTRVIPFWVINGMSVTASPEVIREIAARPDVLSVTADRLPIVPAGSGVLPAANLSAIAVPELWRLGNRGAGTVIASLDSGVDVDHPDLAPRWRGGANSWFDPYGKHAAPVDPTGHGTATLGVMVGGDAGGTAIGVAPAAQFIAARVFDDHGEATATAIHLAFQWVLDPDGDPATPDAPDVVNGSWSYAAPGCHLEFLQDVQALVAAGIVPVFAAGNFGPAASSSVSPANYPASFSAGAVDGQGAAAPDGSRGPSACGGGGYPSVVAPGIDVPTTDLFSGYARFSGTSMAAPHVSGVVALLRSAFPAATVGQIEGAVQRGAVDLGASGPDAVFGAGLVDASAADAQLLHPPVAQPPVAADDEYAASRAGAAFEAPGVLRNDSDPEGRPLVATLAAPPAHGVLTLRSDGGFTYHPEPSFSGEDSFRYRADNGLATSDAATVILTVPAPPSAPITVADAYVIVEGTAGRFEAPAVLQNDFDPGGRPLAARLVQGPAEGTLSLQESGAFEYVPRPGFFGSDSFSYQAFSGEAGGNIATVNLVVIPRDGCR